MKRTCFDKDDLKYLARLVTKAFGIPLTHIFWKRGAGEVKEARRLFCLYLYAVEGMPYKPISKFLRLNHDGARMLLRHLARREPFPYTAIMQHVTTDFRAYLEKRNDERKAESAMDVRSDHGHAEVAEAHDRAP